MYVSGISETSHQNSSDSSVFIMDSDVVSISDPSCDSISDFDSGSSGSSSF